MGGESWLNLRKINSGDVTQPPKGLQSIHRAVSILSVVSRNNDRGIRLSEICDEVGLKTTTTHRLLASLVEEGLVTHDPFSKRYHLGLELFYLGGAAYQYSILEYCRAAMEKIARETEDTVFLSMRSGASGVCLKRVEGAYPVRALTLDEGSRRPLGVGASNLAILANLPDEQIKKVLAFNRELYAYYNNQTEKDIRRLIMQARELGYALYDKILSGDVTAVGLPIRNQRGEVVAAISVAAITSRMESERLKKIVELIKLEIGNVSIPAKDV